MISGRQIAAARALLGVSQADLAGRANISVPTLKRMEASSGEATGLRNNVTAVKTALEQAGISFIDDSTASAAGGEGVRLSASTSQSIDNNFEETVQYPEMAKNDVVGAGG